MWRLGFSRSRFHVAARPDGPQRLVDLSGLSVATSYPTLVGKYLAEAGVSVSLVKLDGAVENVISLGLADGAGKTTAVGHVVGALDGRGIPAVVFDKKITQFGSEYVRRHAGELRALIWEHLADDPYLEWGDMHWVYLQAAWYWPPPSTDQAPALTSARSAVLTSAPSHFHPA
ncbi:hypothetical protein [Micromonospora sp. NPDC092111]|uniref:hypothetical protein n=1 Tax=Micromonospora sp. NPDC092111 TaxID=3364289 RepID=UPI003818909D